MLSSARFTAVLVKEFIQMRRDRMTFAMMIGLPIVQLLLFGFAINSNPRHLPTLIEMHDSGPVTRAIVAAMKNSAYFDIIGTSPGPEASEEALKNGMATFIIVVPTGFERDVISGRKPSILLSADASDPTASGNATAALPGITAAALRLVATGPLAYLKGKADAFEIIVHRQYNPAGVTSYNVVPGLLGIILSMTMVMITAIAIVRESERGTMESLIATPVRPAEVMIGKILPYVGIGYVQTVVFLLLAEIAFGVPFGGSSIAFLLGLNLFIVVNLSLGFLFSTVARNQMQAMQMSFFYIMPSILLSGFVFPFAGMPQWAQILGTCIPTTHFIRIVRKVMLKSAGVTEIVPDMAALGIIMAVIVTVALLRYRQTLD